VAITKVAELVVSQTFANAIVCNNVFHFASESSPPPAVVDLANDFITNFINYNTGPYFGWRSNVTAALHFNTLFARSLYPDASENLSLGLGGAAGFAGGISQVIGIIGAPAAAVTVTAPVVVAALTTWRTGLAGRKYRGRTYWAAIPYIVFLDHAAAIAPGGDINWGINNVPGSRTRATNLPARLMQLYARSRPAVDPFWYLAHISTSLAGNIVPPATRPHLVPPIDPAGVFPVTDYSVPNYWGTMGSRRGGRGV
jgi:hypothetical protein